MLTFHFCLSFACFIAAVLPLQANNNLAHGLHFPTFDDNVLEEPITISTISKPCSFFFKRRIRWRDISRYQQNVLASSTISFADSQTSARWRRFLVGGRNIPTARRSKTSEPNGLGRIAGCNNRKKHSGTIWLPKISSIFFVILTLTLGFYWFLLGRESQSVQQCVTCSKNTMQQGFAGIQRVQMSWKWSYWFVLQLKKQKQKMFVLLYCIWY